MAGPDPVPHPVGRLTEKPLGTMDPDLAGDVTAEIDGRHQLPVGIPEKGDIGHAHLGRRRSLFVTTDGRHLGAGDGVV